jgi:hypothetical protein
LAADSKRYSLIRSGMPTQTFGKRWEEHLRASLRAAMVAMYRNFYWYYPHERVAYNVRGRKGTYQSLEQRMGMGVKKQGKHKLLKLFNWKEAVKSHLSQLSLGPHQAETLGDKHCKHVCYMFELFFAVGVKESENITMNPTCEWQLQLYSKNA